MNILYLGLNAGTSGQRMAALMRLGHQVTHIDPHSMVRWNRALALWQWQTGSLGLAEIIRGRVLRTLDRASPGMPPFDLVWVDHGSLVSAQLLDDLKARVPHVICYNIDDPFGGRDKRLWRQFLKALPSYDLLVVVRSCNIEEARRQGAKRVMRVFMSADEIAHAPRQMTSTERDEWKSEVAFVGTAFPERGPFLAELVRLGLPLALYGGHYRRLREWPLLEPHWRAAKTDTVEGYANAVGAAKICLGLLSKGNRDLHTTRSMEIPSLGGLLCAERTPEHLALYEEDREAVFWDTPEECAEKCFALLADDSRRQAVAAAGHRRYLENPWQNMRVVKTILDEAVRPSVSDGLAVAARSAEAPESQARIGSDLEMRASLTHVDSSSQR